MRFACPRPTEQPKCQQIPDISRGRMYINHSDRNRMVITTMSSKLSVQYEYFNRLPSNGAGTFKIEKTMPRLSSNDHPRTNHSNPYRQSASTRAVHLTHSHPCIHVTTCTHHYSCLLTAVHRPYSERSSAVIARHNEENIHNLRAKRQQRMAPTSWTETSMSESESESRPNCTRTFTDVVVLGCQVSG